MDDYEAEVASTSGGPFTKVEERRRIRWWTEHMHGRKRYSAERARRIKIWIGWIVVGSPVVGTAITLLRFFIAGK